jgi:hypothetical protein
MVYKNIIFLKQLKKKKKIAVKDFVRQLDLNFVLPRLTFSIRKEKVLSRGCNNSSLLHFKTIFYMLVKELKILRASKLILKQRGVLGDGTLNDEKNIETLKKEEAYDKLILNLYRSRFYYSFKEVLKKDRLFFLKRFHMLSFFPELTKKNKENYVAKKKSLLGGKIFKNFFYEEIFSLKDVNRLLKKGGVVATLSKNRKGRTLYRVKRFVRSRFILAQVKKNKLKFFYGDRVLKNLIRLKLKKLPAIYRRYLSKFRRLKFKVIRKLIKYKKRRRRFKKWKRFTLIIKKRGKIVKRLKRKFRHPFFRLYRNRRRAFSRFYIPRYLEINYKTFSFIHLNSKQFSGMSYKIPFYLNLGKILTFISL